MVTAWDKYQELVSEEMKKVYSEIVVDHAMDPRNLGDLDDADGFAKVTGPCGDTMEIRLKIKNGAISAASFITDGCGTTIASGSMVTEMANGKTVPGNATVLLIGNIPITSGSCNSWYRSYNSS